MSSRYDNLLANVPTDLWIGGKWRKSSDGGRFDVLDPATENKIASVASATVEDAKAAVDAASAAFEGWAGRKPRERAHVGAAQARGGRRAGHAVELPRRHGDAQDRPRARGRLHGRAQAGLRYAADHAGADADPGGSRRAGRRGQRHSLALVGQGGERDAARSARARRLLHRL